MQLEQVSQPFPPNLIAEAETARLLLQRIAEGDDLDFLSSETPLDEEHSRKSVVRDQPAPTNPEFTDEQLFQAVLKVAEVTILAAIWLRRDLAFASLDAHGDHSAAIAEIEARANMLRGIDTLRPHALRRVPRLASWWTDENHEATLEAIATSERVIQLLKSGAMEQLPYDKVALELVAVLPTAFGMADNAPDDVIRFCDEEDLALSLLSAVKVIRESFPGAHDPEFELVDDPEGPGSWVTIRVTVPQRDSLARYNRYVSEVVRLIPYEDLHKIRFDYVPE